MELLDARRSVLLLIDFQGKLVQIVERPARTLAVARRLVRLAGMFEVPVLLLEQYPKGIGPTHPELKADFDALTTPKKLLEKTAFGGCGQPGFAELIDSLRPRTGASPRQVVVGGMEAHVCVMQTVIGLLREGDQVQLCWDAISGRGPDYVWHALDRMAQAGAVITNHESVGFEWARNKNHPRFREMSELFKQGQPG